MALGEKLRGRDARVFLIVGDGESNEGQVWEALAFASAKKLDNLVVLLDWNKRQLDGWTEDVYPMGPAWPLEQTSLSRSGHLGSAALYFISLPYNTASTSAM